MDFISHFDNNNNHVYVYFIFIRYLEVKMITKNINVYLA